LLSAGDCLLIATVFLSPPACLAEARQLIATIASRYLLLAEGRQLPADRQSSLVAICFLLTAEG